MMTPLPDLLPGDVLLYGGGGPLYWAIRTKTWSDVGHVELYIGDDRTVTAKLRGGVDEYPFTTKNLRYVYRPLTATWDREQAFTRFDAEMRGQKYDWKGLLASFYAVKQGRENNRAFCSEAVTRVLRWGGVEPFNPDFDADAVAPAQFKQTPMLRCVWRYR